MWGGGKKRPRPPVGMTRIRDRGHVQCAQLKFHTPGLPNYEGASIALASFYEGKGAGAHRFRPCTPPRPQREHPFSAKSPILRRVDHAWHLHR